MDVFEFDFEYLNARTGEKLDSYMDIYELAIEELGLEEYYRLRYEEGFDHEMLREYLWEKEIVNKKVLSADNQEQEIGRIRRTRLKEIQESLRIERKRQVLGLGTVGYIFMKDGALTSDNGHVKFFEYDGLLHQYIRKLFQPNGGAYSAQGVYQEVRITKVLADFKDCKAIREFFQNNPLDETNVCYEIPYVKLAMLIEAGKVKLM